MPCDTIQLNTIDVGKLNPTLRDRAMLAIGATTNGYGWYVLDGEQFQIRNGQIIGAQSPAVLAKIAARLKQSYSGEVVKYTAARNGWTVKQTGAFQYQVTK